MQRKMGGHLKATQLRDKRAPIAVLPPLICSQTISEVRGTPGGQDVSPQCPFQSPPQTKDTRGPAKCLKEDGTAAAALKEILFCLPVSRGLGEEKP